MYILKEYSGVIITTIVILVLSVFVHVGVIKTPSMQPVLKTTSIVVCVKPITYKIYHFLFYTPSFQSFDTWFAKNIEKKPICFYENCQMIQNTPVSSSRKIILHYAHRYENPDIFRIASEETYLRYPELKIRNNELELKILPYIRQKNVIGVYSFTLCSNLIVCNIVSFITSYKIYFMILFLILEIIYNILK